MFCISWFRLNLPTSQSGVTLARYFWKREITSKNTLFEHYTIESAHENEIYLQISESHLISTLKSGSQSIETWIKLTKKDGQAVLALNMTDHVCLVADSPFRALAISP